MWLSDVRTEGAAGVRCLKLEVMSVIVLNSQVLL